MKINGRFEGNLGKKDFSEGTQNSKLSLFRKTPKHDFAVCKLLKSIGLLVGFSSRKTFWSELKIQNSKLKIQNFIIGIFDMGFVARYPPVISNS
ncbi:hypothetical protein D7D25_03150 [Proteiniphilum sp. X52]|nr:hypothetical protein D7D25_03150 [Proteiniphilum sp. X52]